MKKTYYFSHDSNAHNDPKITAMIKKYGIAGYGMYWIIIECLREQENYKLLLKKWSYESLAVKMCCDTDKVIDFIKSLIDEYELLSSDKKYLWSDSLNRRMELMDKKSEQARVAAFKSWENRGKGKENDADA